MENADMLKEIQKAKQVLNMMTSNREKLLDTVNYWLDRFKEIEEARRKEIKYVV